MGCIQSNHSISNDVVLRSDPNWSLSATGHPDGEKARESRREPPSLAKPKDTQLAVEKGPKIVSSTPFPFVHPGASGRKEIKDGDVKIDADDLELHSENEVKQFASLVDDVTITRSLSSPESDANDTLDNDLKNNVNISNEQESFQENADLNANATLYNDLRNNVNIANEQELLQENATLNKKPSDRTTASQQAIENDALNTISPITGTVSPPSDVTDPSSRTSGKTRNTIARASFFEQKINDHAMKQEIMNSFDGLGKKFNEELRAPKHSETSNETQVKSCLAEQESKTQPSDLTSSYNQKRATFQVNSAKQQIQNPKRQSAWINNNSPTIKDLIERLSVNDPTLSTLELNNNASFSMKADSYAMDLAEALKNNRVCKSLSLSSNMIGDKGATALGEMLSKNNVLRCLDLSKNKIQQEGAISIA
eukprot:UC4_evm2s837